MEVAAARLTVDFPYVLLSPTKDTQNQGRRKPRTSLTTLSAEAKMIVGLIRDFQTAQVTNC